MNNAERYVSEKSVKRTAMKVLVIGALLGTIGGITFNKYGMPPIEKEVRQTIHELRLDYDEEYANSYYMKHPVEWIKTKF